MTPREVTAADFEAALAVVAQCPHDCSACADCIATALATVRADWANDPRTKLLSQEHYALASQRADLYARVTALEAERDQLGTEMLKWSQTARELRDRVTALEAELRELREQQAIARADAAEKERTP